MGSVLSPAGLILVVLIVFVGLALLLQLFYVLWYRQRFRQRSATDSEFASIISPDCSGTPVSKELALYYLYYRNQSPSAVPDNNADTVSTSQPMRRASAPAVAEAMEEPPAPPPPPPEAAAAVSSGDEELESDEYEQDPDAMMCPSFSGMVRDFAEEAYTAERTASAPAGGGRTTSREVYDRLDASSSTSQPVRDALEFNRYAGKAARRVALPS